MTFAQSIETCLVQKYFFVFRGRASRSEFWWFMLFIGLVNLASSLLFMLFPQTWRPLLSLALSLLLLPPNLGVTVRRLHDRGMRGWWLLLPIGALFLWILAGGGAGAVNNNSFSNVLSLGMVLCYLIILCMPGAPGPNRFGPSPLAKKGLKEES